MSPSELARQQAICHWLATRGPMAISGMVKWIGQTRPPIAHSVRELVRKGYIQELPEPYVELGRPAAMFKLVNPEGLKEETFYLELERGDAYTQKWRKVLRLLTLGPQQ
jgi:predicted ArsR family transcriptional regulator